MQTNQAFWRKLFVVAALFNLGAAALLAFGHRMLVSQLGMTPAAEPALYLHIMTVAIAIFGWGYYLVSRDLSQTAVVRIGAWAKLAVVAVIGGYWAAGQCSWHLPLLASGDLLFAGAFFRFLAQRERVRR